MKTGKQRKCAGRGCTERFVPVRDNQVYHDRRCANREKQRRLHARAKKATAASL